MQLLRDIRGQNSPDQFRMCLLTVDADSHTAFSLAGLAFPELEDFKAWLNFLSEVLAVPHQEAAQYPHFLLLQGSTHQIRYSDELFEQVCGSVQPPVLNKMMKNRFGNWVKYAQLLPQGFPVSVVEILAKSGKEQTLSYVLELGLDCNFISGLEPLWLILAKVPINEKHWACLHAPCLYYIKKGNMLVHSYEYQYECLSWLNRLHSSAHSIAPALHYCLEALKTRVPDYTKTYFKSLWELHPYDPPLYVQLEQHIESLL